MATIVWRDCSVLILKEYCVNVRSKLKIKRFIASLPRSVVFLLYIGAVAQLGERLNGIYFQCHRFISLMFSMACCDLKNHRTGDNIFSGVIPCFLLSGAQLLHIGPR
jgi:hypothetical protein